MLRESLEGRGLLGFASHHAHEDLRVTKVGRDFHAGHSDESHDARILRRLGEERRYFFADRLANAIRATSVTHRDQAVAVDVSVRATCSWR